MSNCNHPRTSIPTYTAINIKTSVEKTATTMSELGSILGLSRQRVHQILTEDAEPIRGRAWDVVKGSRLKKCALCVKELTSAPAFLEGEEWRASSKYADLFVSNYGRLYTTSRGYKREINTVRSSGNYVNVQVATGKSNYVHRLVAFEFHGDSYREGREVNHKDGDKTNNHASNIEWVTPAENIAHYYTTLVPQRRAAL